MAEAQRLHFESEYDPDADVLYVLWGEEPTTHGLEVRPGVIVRLTETDRFEGLTVYDVTRRFPFDPAGDVPTQASALAADLLAALVAPAVLGQLPK